MIDDIGIHPIVKDLPIDRISRPTRRCRPGLLYDVIQENVGMGIYFAASKSRLESRRT